MSAGEHLANIGKVPEHLDKWIEDARQGRQGRAGAKIKPVRAVDSDGSVIEIGSGYEITRKQHDESQSSGATWNERVLIVQSNSYAEVGRKALKHRLERATEALLGLTPEPGRGRRQYGEQVELEAAAQAIVGEHTVHRGRAADMADQPGSPETTQARVWRQPGAHRPARTEVTIRLVISVTQDAAAIELAENNLGWRVYVTNAPRNELSFEQAVLAYRDEWLIERDFARLKGRSLSLAPLWLKREDHALGMTRLLTRLLTLAVRVLALAEHEARANLKQDADALAGLYPSRHNRKTQRPTTERLLKAFDHIMITMLQIGDSMRVHVTKLSQLQTKILALLGCPADLYRRLVDNLGFA